MGSSPCCYFHHPQSPTAKFSKNIVLPPNESKPHPAFYHNRVSKSEYGLNVKKKSKSLKSTISFYNKNNLEDMTEKDFIESYYPQFGEHNEFIDKLYFTEAELKHYNVVNFGQERKKLKKTVKQKIRFTKGEILGNGSFGTVYLGFNKDNGQLMAIKEIFITSSSNLSRDNKKKLDDEIEILKDLRHENVVRFLGSQRSFKTIYLFFEYISGGNLTSLISKFGKLNESLIRRYCKQILEGLEYLHVKGVVHSDIKGPNILVDKNGVCKLTDFGSAIKLYRNASMTKEVQISGTANWMAPEVIRQEGYGRSADIWSFGCTVLEMLTGKLPWSEYQNPYSIMFNVAKGNAKPSFPTDCSDDLKDFLSKCLKHDPMERYNCYKLLRHDFITKNAVASSPFQSISLEKLPKVFK